jgi:integrase
VGIDVGLKAKHMARVTGKLSALDVSRALRSAKRGNSSTTMHPDGGGLYLQAKGLTGCSWIFRYERGGKQRYLGLGSAELVSLAEARDKALAARKLLLNGVDPIEANMAARASAALEAAMGMTFKSCAEAYIDTHKAGWRNAKHADQWGSTLKAYAYPIFGELPVSSIDVGLVMKALEPIWTAKTETASRVRGRIEAVLDWATVRGYRQGNNPARWRGHLDSLLPRRAKVQRVEHHAALPYAEMGVFMEALRQQEGVSALALEFLILTATRTSETIGATWGEFDLDAATWTVPAERIKAGKEHRVPLSPAALLIVKRLAQSNAGEFVFPGGKRGRPLSNMALLKLLERMGRADLTVHGFRSSFRDWAAERTNFPREVAEMALAHAVSDKVEAAYRRGDLFQKRRQLMEGWAKFCARPIAAKPITNIVSMRS